MSIAPETDRQKIHSEKAEDDRLGLEAVRGKYISEEQLKEARAIQEKFRALGLIARSLGEIFLQRGYVSRYELRELYRKISPDVNLPKIKGYRVVAKIGEGGMGTVYEARQSSLDRKVALKILHPALAEDDMYLRRFIREAQVVAMLNHPNIVSGIDVGESHGFHYFVMEFVEGKTVKEVLREQGFMAQKRAFEIGHMMALGLDQAFRHGLVHRDIKPENIILTEERIAKLCDLGLARPEGSDDTLTQSGATHGTPFYMSPEQACGEPIDTRSDIYALGVTMYEMVTGERPFGGRTAAEVLVRQISEEPVPPRSVNALITDEAQAVILKMMAKRPTARYQDPRQLASDLEAVIYGRMPKGIRQINIDVTQAVGTSATLEPVVHRVRRDWVVWALVLIAMYSAGITAFLLSRAMRGEDPKAKDPGEKVTIGKSNGSQKDPPKKTQEEREEETFNLLVDMQAKYRDVIESKVDHADQVKRIDEAIARYGEFREKCGQQHLRVKAQDRILTLEGWRDRVRKRSYKKWVTEVRRHVASGQYEAAMDIIRRLLWTDDWAKERHILETEIREAAVSRMINVIKNAERVARGGTRDDYAQAIEIIGIFLASKPPIQLTDVETVLVGLRRKLKDAVEKDVSRLENADDAALYKAYESQVGALGRFEFDRVHDALIERSKRKQHGQRTMRHIRWLAKFLRLGGQIIGSTKRMLAEAAENSKKNHLLHGPMRDLKNGKLLRVDGNVIWMKVNGREVPVRLIDQPLDTILWWAEQDKKKPDKQARASLRVSLGLLKVAQTELERMDSLYVELLERLRWHGGSLKLAEYHKMLTEEKPDIDALDKLITDLLANYVDTPSVLPHFESLNAKLRAVKLQQARRKVAPQGSVISKGPRWTVRYEFKKASDVGDWVLGSGWGRTKGRLTGATKGKAVTYKYLVQPGCKLKLTVSLGTAGKRPADRPPPGMVLEWLQADRTLRFVLEPDGSAALAWDDRSAPIASGTLTGLGEGNKLSHGFHNLELELNRTDVSVRVNGRAVHLKAKLARPLENGSLRVVVADCPLSLTDMSITAKLLYRE